MPERKITYQTLQDRTHLAFLVKAPSLQRLYIDAGLALSDILVTQDVITEAEKHRARASGDTKEALLINWLNEVLKLVLEQQFLTRRIVFDVFDGKRIEATLWGEKYQSTKHGSLPHARSVVSSPFEMGDLGGAEPMFYAKVYLSLQ